MISDILENVLRAAAKRTEDELYAAWRADYDFLYVVHDRRPLDLPSMAYIPSNNSDHKFRGFVVERYDLRDEHHPPEVSEFLRQFKR